MSRFNKENEHNINPIDYTIHREAYINSYLQDLIEQYEDGNNETIDFHREYISALMNKLKSIKIINPQGGIHSDIKVFHGTSERAIAMLHDERNLKLPVISVVANDLEGAIERRKPDFNPIIERLYDPKARKAQRVISLSPKAVNINFRVSIYDRYTENINQMVEQIELMFHPYGVVKTDFGTSTHAYLTDWADQSVLTAGDRENRILVKSCLISLEAYIPTKKYLMTSSDKIHAINPDSIEQISTEGGIKEVDNTPVGGGGNGDANKVEYYLDQKTVLSDGYTMLYNIYLPTTRNEFGGKLPLIVITPSTGGWRYSSPPSKQFVDDTTNPDPFNITELLLSEGYAVIKYDVRGQAKPWSSQGGGGVDSSFFHPDNTQYSVSSEFGAENFCVRELLDLFEVRDHTVSAWASAVDSERVGTMGGSLGGLTASMGTAWSGKTVPYDAIVSSQDAFNAAGASAIEALSGDWGYTSSTEFTTFKASCIASFIGDLEELTSPDGVRGPFLSGPLRTFDLNFYAPRELDLLEEAFRNDDIISYSDSVGLRNPFSTEFATSVVPTLFQFSYDDRQRSIEVPLNLFKTFSGPKHFFAGTGHHSSPENREADIIRNTNIIKWLDEHVKDYSNVFPRGTQYMFMETPSDVETYRDNLDERVYRETDSDTFPQIINAPYVLSKDGSDNVILQKEPSAVSASTSGTSLISHEMLAGSLASSTSQFIDRIIQFRGSVEFKAQDMIGNWFTDSSKVFFTSTPFEKDTLLFGQVSGVLSVSSDTSGQFSYDIMDYDPSKPLGKWNPRVVTTGVQSFSSTIDETLNVNSRFQAYKFEQGHFIAIRLKNHTLFSPAIEDSDRSTFTVLPYFTDYNAQFDLSNAECYFRIPLIQYSLLP